MPVETLRIAKADLGFCRMDVDVDLIGRKLQKQKGDRISARHQQPAIRLAERVLQRAVLDEAAIEEQILALPRRTVFAGMANVTPQTGRVGLRFDPYQAVGQIRAEEQLEPLEYLVSRRQLVDHPLVVPQDGGQPRASQRDPRELLADVPELGRH